MKLEQYDKILGALLMASAGAGMRKDGRRQTPEEMLEMARFVLLPLK